MGEFTEFTCIITPTDADRDVHVSFFFIEGNIFVLTLFWSSEFSSLRDSLLAQTRAEGNMIATSLDELAHRFDTVSLRATEVHADIQRSSRETELLFTSVQSTLAEAITRMKELQKNDEMLRRDIISEQTQTITLLREQNSQLMEEKTKTNYMM